LSHVDDEACIRERRDRQEMAGGGKGRVCTSPAITSVDGRFYVARFFDNL
jgi:hypothetical protein